MQYSDNFLVKRCRSFHMYQKEKRLLRIYGKRPVTVHHGPNPNFPLDYFFGSRWIFFRSQVFRRWPSIKVPTFSDNVFDGIFETHILRTQLLLTCFSTKSLYVGKLWRLPCDTTANVNDDWWTSHHMIKLMGLVMRVRITIQTYCYSHVFRLYVARYYPHVHTCIYVYTYNTYIYIYINIWYIYIYRCYIYIY